MFEHFRTTTAVRRMFGISVALVTAATAIEAAAQTVPVVKLQAANATLLEEFSNLSVHALRELADGRVLISETGPESRLVVADFKTGAVSQLGRKGNGPGEYEFGIGIFALSHDSTVMVAGQQRWLMLIGAKIVQTLPLSHNISTLPMAFDSLGSLLAMVATPPASDSARLAVMNRTSNVNTAVIEIATRAEPGYPLPVVKTPNGTTRYSRGAWLGVEQALLFPDGWLAVARYRPYRVDWRSVDGKWMKGAPLPVPETAVNSREKAALMQREANRTGSAVKEPTAYPAWPKVIPPFLSGTHFLATPDGKLLVPRTPTADHPEMRYDIVNRLGKLERQLDIGNANRILGFGRNSVYVSTIDDNGIQHISRHPWM